jgi:hypothetical protein
MIARQRLVMIRRQTFAVIVTRVMTDLHTRNALCMRMMPTAAQQHVQS